MGRDKSLSKGSVGSASMSSMPTESSLPMVEAYAAEASGSDVDRTTNIQSGGGGISINVNINSGKPDSFAGGGGFGGAAAMNVTQTKDGEIVEVARSPTHKKRRGNKIVREHVEMEYSVPGGVDEKAMRAYLTENQWPPGLQTALVDTCKKMPVRFFITDDSGSMLTNDGHRIVGAGDKKKLIACTRWSELVSSLKFHATLAHKAHAPSEFRLLNNAEPVLVGMPGDDEALELIMDVFNDGPGGQTPICAQIHEVVKKIKSIDDQLRANNQRAAVIIATDGISTDGDVADAMRPLQDLAVWVVVRLCTDDDEVIEYWNNIDSELELEMDVLDDVEGEAKEVRAVNDWLYYGEPLHRLREFGAAIKEMDLIDEDALSSEQMSVIVSHLCCGAKRLPHPDEDWGVFVDTVKKGLKEHKLTWDPIERQPQPWVNVKLLEKHYGPPQSSACVLS